MVRVDFCVSTLRRWALAPSAQVKVAVAKNAVRFTGYLSIADSERKGQKLGTNRAWAAEDPNQASVDEPQQSQNRSALLAPQSAELDRTPSPHQTTDRSPPTRPSERSVVT